MFLKKLAKELPEYLSINKYIISLKVNKKLFYNLIYGFKLIKIEIFKTYIKINLVNLFILLSEFFTGVLILFIRKTNKNFFLDIYY